MASWTSSDVFSQNPFQTATNLGCHPRSGLMRWIMDMRCGASRNAVHGLASILSLILLVAGAAAQDSDIRNIELCNASDPTAAELQINGCTALIKSLENPRALAIAYNNRGNAYTGKGDYEQA